MEDFNYKHICRGDILDLHIKQMQQITLYQYTTGVKHINLFTDEMSSDLHIFGFERSIRPNVPVVPVL